MRTKNKVKIDENGTKLVWCRGCKTYLPESRFYRLSGRPHADACKDCRRKFAKRYYDKYRRKKKPEPVEVIKIKQKTAKDINKKIYEKIVRKESGALV